MKPQPMALPLAFLVLTVLSACNLSSARDLASSATKPAATAPPVLPTTVPTATIPPATPTPMPAPASPTPRPPSPTPMTPSPTPGSPVSTPVDLFSFPIVHWMGRLSLTQGWVQSDGRLLWTGDAGASWSDITPAGLSNCPEPDSCYIASPPVFLDSSRVRITVVRGQEYDPPTALSFMYTDNGGRTWGLRPIADFAHSLICPGDACISGADLEFPDGQHGWLAAYAPLGMSSDVAYIWRTRDGGQTWTPLDMPVTGQVVFIDGSTGWAVGGEIRFVSDQFLRTLDGGDSWQPVSIALPEWYTGAGYYFQEPVFLSHAEGVLPVRFNLDDNGNRRTGFYTTQNAGASWSLTATLEDPDLDSFGPDTPIPWSVVDESTWFLALSEATQYLTRDRGQTWKAFPAAGLGGARLLEVQFASEAAGWGRGQICDRDTGCSQPMFATHDGGRTWMPIAPAP